VRDGVVFAYRNHTADKEPNGDYFGGTDLMAVDADTGKVLWTAEMPQDDRTDQAAMLIDGAVLANTPSLRTMSALDPRTGEEKWRHTWDKGIVCQRAVLSGVPYLLCNQDIKKPNDTDIFRLDPATGSAEKVTTLPGSHQLIGTSGDRMVLISAKSVGDKDLRLTTVSGSGKQSSHAYRIEGEPAKSDIVGDLLISVSWQGKASAYSLTAGKTLWTAPVGVKMPKKDTLAGLAAPVLSMGQWVVYFAGPAGDLSGLDVRTGEQIWRGHTDTGSQKPGPTSWNPPQLLLYDDVLVTRNGSTLVSLLPRIKD
jgi:outer membrane protein assembly factor BamB